MAKSDKANSQTYSLSDIRVLDLTDEKGVYCGKLLADLGADVIKIERPGGDPMRRLGPFFRDSMRIEESLFWFNFNTNKRGITLNIEHRWGQEILKRLAKTSSVILESYMPGYLDDLGIGYEALHKLNSGLIFTSITGFGQTGPFKDFKPSDIAAAAMGGLMYISGFPERAPSFPGASQSYYLGSVNGAIGTLAALIARDISGLGQQVDVSLQEAVCTAIETAMVQYDVNKNNRKRTGRRLFRYWNEVWQCKNGYVVCSPLGGGGWRQILDWMSSEGMADDLTNNQYKELFATMARYMGGEEQEPRSKIPSLKPYIRDIEHVEEVWSRFLMAHHKEELFKFCQERGIALMPISSVVDVVNDIHLREVGYFVEIEHSELGIHALYPGPPYRLSDTPCIYPHNC